MKSTSKRIVALLLTMLMIIPAMSTMVSAASAEDTVTEASLVPESPLFSTEDENSRYEEEILPEEEYSEWAEDDEVSEEEIEPQESPIERIVIPTIYVDRWQDMGQREEYLEEYDQWDYFTSYEWRYKMIGTVYFKDGTTGELSNGYVYYDYDYYSVSCVDNQSYDNQWEVGGTYTGTITVMNYTMDVEVIVTEQNSIDNITYLEYDDGIIINNTYGEADVLDIPETINGKPVIAILDLDYGEFKEIIIPDSVITISESAIRYNWELEKITIGAGVETLTNEMFYYSELSEIVISEGNENYASVDGIVYDKDLTTMVAIAPKKTSTHTVPETVTNIDLYIEGTYLFQIVLKNDATGYFVEDGILYDGDKTTVYSCSADKTGDYVMPETVTTIKPLAFYYSNLESVTVSSNVTDITYYAFYGSENLKKVVLPDTLETIGEYAFYDCENLTDVSIPDGLITLDDYAFNNTGIKTITIPAGLEYWGYAVFAYSDLETVILSEGIERIPSSSFAVTKIKTVNLPNSLISIGSGAFSSTPLQSIDLKNVVSIDSHAFWNTELTSITFPESLAWIAYYAFANTKLTELYIPANVTYIGEGAFSGAPVKKLTLADGITMTNDYAFSNIDIESLEFPESVTDIAYYSFVNCTDLTNIDLPDNLQSLCGHAFDGSAWLNNQPDGVVYLDQALYGYKGEMPDNTSIAVKSGTKLIADYAFDSQYNLMSISLPESLEYIGYAAFAYCYNMTDIYCEADSQPDNWPYYWNYNDATVHWGCNFAKITKQPTNVAVSNGSTAKVTVTATGDDLTYKWYYKNKGDSKFSLTTTFTGNTYSAEMNSTRAGRQLYCVITDKYGNSVTTNTVTIGMPVKITKQPTSVAVQSGKTAKVTVTATGDGLTYKWYYKNKGDSKFTLTNSFKGNFYSVEMNSTRAGRQIYCVITDKYGKSVTSNTVTLSMSGVKITKQPTNVAVQSGKTAKVTVTATGEGLKYKWYYKNKGASKFSLTTTFTGNTYYVTMDSTRAGRQVYCVITDKYGNSVKTNTVTLGMAAKITTQPTSVKVANGKTAKVTVKASGEGLKYKWYYKDKGASKFNLTTTFTGNTYSVTMTNARAGRQVYCVITDKYGNSVKTNTVTLNKR